MDPGERTDPAGVWPPQSQSRRMGRSDRTLSLPLGRRAPSFLPVHPITVCSRLNDFSSPPSMDLKPNMISHRVVGLLVRSPLGWLS